MIHRHNFTSSKKINLVFSHTLQITLTSKDSAVDLTHYQTNAEWSIMSSSVSTSVVSAQSYLTFTFNLDRTPGYFVVNMLIPILILGLLNGLVFVLPADSGERGGVRHYCFPDLRRVLVSRVGQPPRRRPSRCRCFVIS